MKIILNAVRQFHSYSSEIHIVSLQSLHQGRFDYLQEKSYSLLLKNIEKVGIRGEIKRQGKNSCIVKR